MNKVFIFELLKSIQIQYIGNQKLVIFVPMDGISIFIVVFTSVLILSLLLVFVVWFWYACCRPTISHTSTSVPYDGNKRIGVIKGNDGQMIPVYSDQKTHYMTNTGHSQNQDLMVGHMNEALVFGE